MCNSGCAVSQLLGTGFLKVRRAGAPLRRPWSASCCGDTDCCRARLRARRLQSAGWVVRHTSLVALRPVGSAWTRDQNRGPWLGRWILDRHRQGSLYHRMLAIVLCAERQPLSVERRQTRWGRGAEGEGKHAQRCQGRREGPTRGRLRCLCPTRWSEAGEGRQPQVVQACVLGKRQPGTVTTPAVPVWLPADTFVFPLQKLAQVFDMEWKSTPNRITVSYVSGLGFRIIKVSIKGKKNLG